MISRGFIVADKIRLKKEISNWNLMFIRLSIIIIKPVQYPLLFINTLNYINNDLHLKAEPRFRLEIANKHSYH